MIQGNGTANLVNGAFNKLYLKISEAYYESVASHGRPYLSREDWDSVYAPHLEMTNELALYRLFVLRESSVRKNGLVDFIQKSLVTVVMKIERGREIIIFSVDSSFDRYEKVRELLAEAMEEIKKYASNTSIVFLRL